MKNIKNNLVLRFLFLKPYRILKKSIISNKEKVLILKQAYKYGLGTKSEYIFNNGKGMIQYLPLYKKDLIQKQILIQANYYEIEFLQYVKANWAKNIKKGNVLDIGANIGNHSIYFAKECGAQKVFSFEPVTLTYNNLVQNIKVNKLINIIITDNCAVGSKEGKGTIYSTVHGNSGATRICSTGNGEFEIKTIDSMKIDNVKFIKIDTEGFELEVLKGAKKTILINKPILWVEVEDKNLQKFREMMQEWNYSEIQFDGWANYIYQCI